MGSRERHAAGGRKLVASGMMKSKSKKKGIRKSLGEARWSVI